jgi:hypothetical protein
MEKVPNGGEIKGITSEDISRRFIINRGRRCWVDYREKATIWPRVSNAAAHCADAPQHRVH